jgi:dCTP deaminase
MILSDREIRAALLREAVRIYPQPADEQFSSTAVDLTLADELRVWKKPGKRTRREISPADPDFNFAAVVAAHSTVLTIPSDGHLLRPGELVLGWTSERIQLPHRARLAARVEGKSTLARIGLGVHVTAPTIHAGFGFRGAEPDYPGSPIQLEIFHIGLIPIRMKPGMAICQLIFEEVHGTPEKGYGGQFTRQGPTQ